MKIYVDRDGHRVEVVSEPDGDLPAPATISGKLIALGTGLVLVPKQFREDLEIASYLALFSEYLETGGKGRDRKIVWVPDSVFEVFNSNLLPVPKTNVPILPDLPIETGQEVHSPSFSGIPSIFSDKVILMEDGQVAALSSLRNRDDFKDFIRTYSLHMEACGKIGQMRVSYLSERAIQDLLSNRESEDNDEDCSRILAELGLDAEGRFREEMSSGGVVPEKPEHPERVPDPEKSLVDRPDGEALTLPSGLPVQKEASSTSSGPECLSTPSGGTIPDFRAPEDIASMVLLIMDGRFYVSREHKTNQHVNYYYRHLVPDLWPKIFGGKPLPKPQFVSYETLRKIRRDSFPEETFSAGYKAEGDEARKIMEIIREAIARKASDIHLRIERDRTRILYRIHGWLKPVQTLTHDEGERLARIVYNTMLDSSGRDNMFSDKKPQDGQFRQDYLPRGTFNIREFHAPTGGTGLGTLTMVLRLQYGSGTATADAQEIDTLGYDESHLAQLRFLMGLSYGIVLFSGPMGSGKSTSMASILRVVLEMNPLEEGRGLHLATLEDPPEYEIPTASQIAVPGGQFSEVLGRIMRFDANLLMIGEIRDEATAEKAVEGAMSGHVVYSTVHANDVLSIPRRLDGLKIRRDLLCDPTIFRGMICQRLIPLLCQDCKISWENAEKAGTLRPDLVKRLEAVSIDPKTVFFHDPRGCKSCGTQGIVGRTIVAEILIPDQEILDLVANGRMTEAWGYYSEKLDGRTMMDHALDKIRAGIIDPRDVEAKLGWIHAGTLDSRSVRDIIGGLVH